jgi:hypothetical protein
VSHVVRHWYRTIARPAMPARSPSRDCAATLLRRARAAAGTALGLMTAAYAAASGALLHPRDDRTLYGAAHVLTLAALACFACFTVMTMMARGLARSQDRTGQPVFRCICCGGTSPHPDDVASSYCARCHWFAADPELPGNGHLDRPCPQREYRL